MMTALVPNVIISDLRNKKKNINIIASLAIQIES